MIGRYSLTKSIALKYYLIIATVFCVLTACTPRPQVAVIAPSSCPSLAAIKKAESSLPEWKWRDYVPSVCNDGLNRNSSAYLKQKEVQAESIIKALQDSPDVLWAAKGGNGAEFTIREMMRKGYPRVVPPLLLGMSDTTRLQIYFLQRFPQQFRAIQSPAFQSLAIISLQDSLREFLQAYLSRQAYQWKVKLQAANHTAGHRKESIKGRVVGGLLNSVFYERNRLKSVLPGKILFLEMHRQATADMIIALDKEGFFDGVRAVVTGHVIKPENALSILAARLDKKCIPLLSGYPFGHDMKKPFEWLPINFPAVLSTGVTPEIAFTTM